MKTGCRWLNLVKLEHLLDFRVVDFGQRSKQTQTC